MPRSLQGVSTSWDKGGDLYTFSFLFQASSRFMHCYKVKMVYELLYFLGCKQECFGLCIFGNHWKGKYFCHLKMHYFYFSPGCQLSECLDLLFFSKQLLLVPEDCANLILHFLWISNLNYGQKFKLCQKLHLNIQKLKRNRNDLKTYRLLNVISCKPTLISGLISFLLDLFHCIKPHSELCCFWVSTVKYMITYPSAYTSV